MISSSLFYQNAHKKHPLLKVDTKEGLYLNPERLVNNSSVCGNREVKVKDGTLQTQKRNCMMIFEHILHLARICRPCGLSIIR